MYSIGIFLNTHKFASRVNTPILLESKEVDTRAFAQCHRRALTGPTRWVVDFGVWGHGD